MKTMPRPSRSSRRSRPLARRLNFRAKSVRALSAERRAKQLAQMPDVSDAVASRALVAYHFAAERPLMGAFLDALGIAHDQGLIKEDEVAPPDAAKTASAVKAVREAFPADAVNLYLKTLVSIDPETWAALDSQMTRVINWVEWRRDRPSDLEARPV